MEKDIWKCTKCHRAFSLSERAEDYPRIPHNLILCQLCVEDTCSVCDSCHEYFYSENPVQVEDENLCDICAGTNTIICSTCGKIALNKRTNPKREIDGLCQDCETFELYKRHIMQYAQNIRHPFYTSFWELKDLASTPIMTELRRGGTDALIVRFTDFGLVKKYGRPLRAPQICGEHTMTEFKRSSQWAWMHRSDDLATDFHTSLNNGCVFTLWRQPFWIRAVTDDDKDFRKEFYCGELEYEGNNYGDTSDFYIVGSIDIPIEHFREW